MHFKIPFALFIVLSFLTLIACTKAEPTSQPTPLPSKEWRIEGIEQNGGDVVVKVRVYAGIDVYVVLDGTAPDIAKQSLPLLEFVFRNTPAGMHTVLVSDLVGHSESRDFWVSELPSTNPEWLTALINKLQNEPVANPPARILQYNYNGQTVYYLPSRCCDIFGDLYDNNGNLIAHPDGGLTGRGDGRAPDFFEKRSNERLIWADNRKHDPTRTQVPAPIDDVQIAVMKSLPPQYQLEITSGLPGSCHTFGGYFFNRTAYIVNVQVVNSKPTSSNIACAQIYGVVKTSIYLGSDFEKGQTYTIKVNEVTRTFVAQ